MRSVTKVLILLHSSHNDKNINISIQTYIKNRKQEVEGGGTS
jgi:hypothetical protein